MNPAQQLPQAGPDEMLRDCKLCRREVLARRKPDGGQGTWTQEPHNAPCGLPCRSRERPPLAEEHGDRGCPRCVENHPRAPKAKRGTVRARARRRR